APATIATTPMPANAVQALLDPAAPRPPGAWGAFLLFLIPVGGGIPAGVLLARDSGVSPPMMAALYFLSDVVLAFAFEPLIRLLLALGRWVPPLARLGRRLGGVFQGGGAGAHAGRGPLGLVPVSFSVDPISGRTAAAAAGHGFVPGWALAIAGDMLHFTLPMASTLWLRGVLGDERLTVGAMLVLMLVLPSLVRRWKARLTAAPLSARRGRASAAPGRCSRAIARSDRPPPGLPASRR